MQQPCYTFTMENNTSLIGQTVTVKRFGTTRKIDLYVTQIEVIDNDTLLIGLIPSKKYPGNYRGKGSAWLSEMC